MKRTILESWELFVKYQMKIHNETSKECDFDTFRDFLLNTPLKVCCLPFELDLNVLFIVLISKFCYFYLKSALKLINLSSMSVLKKYWF